MSLLRTLASRTAGRRRFERRYLVSVLERATYEGVAGACAFGPVAMIRAWPVRERMPTRMASRVAPAPAGRGS